MKPKILLNNWQSQKRWTFVLNAVLLYYLCFDLAFGFSFYSLWAPILAKSQSAQINQPNHNKSNHILVHGIQSSSDNNSNSSNNGADNNDSNHNHNSNKKTEQNPNDITLSNQVSFVDWFVSREVDSLMHDSTANTASKSPESTYDIEICSIDRRLEKNGVYDKLDTLVNKFEDVAMRSNDKVAESLRDGLAKAIELDEIAELINDSTNLLNYNNAEFKSSPAPSLSSKYKSKIAPSKGLLDLFDEVNPNMVHRKISNKATKRLVAFALNQPKYSDRLILSKMFAHVLSNSAATTTVTANNGVKENVIGDETTPMVKKSTKDPSGQLTSSKNIKKAAKVVGAAVSLAIVVFEELYLSPSFLEHLPIIGAGIRKLKKFGQSPYDIIQAVRSVHEFLNNYKEAPGSDPILKISHIMNKNSPLMFSQKGLDSLTRIATRLVDSNKKGRNMTLEDKKEIAGRSAFYFLINFAKSLGGCKLAHRKHG